MREDGEERDEIESAVGKREVLDLRQRNPVGVVKRVASGELVKLETLAVNVFVEPVDDLARHVDTDISTDGRCSSERILTSLVPHPISKTSTSRRSAPRWFVP